MKPYLLGLYEKALPDGWSWLERMRAAAEAGFDFIEMSIDESARRQERLQWSRPQRREFAIWSRQNLDVSSICLSAHRKYPIGSHFRDIREQGMQVMESAIELAYDLGIRMIQLAGYDVYYNEASDDESKKYFTENLFRSARMAASRGVLLGLETMETDFMDTVEKAVRYVAEICSPYLEVYPDIGNVSNAVQDVAGDLRKGAGHMISAHLKETKPGIYRNLLYGEGTVDFQMAVRTLMELGVSRLTAEFWHLPGADPVEDITFTHTYFTNILRRFSDAVMEKDGGMARC